MRDATNESAPTYYFNQINAMILQVLFAAAGEDGTTTDRQKSRRRLYRPKAVILVSKLAWV